MHNISIIAPSAAPISSIVREHLAAAATARGRGDHALADLHEHDAERALRACIAAAKEAARHG